MPQFTTATSSSSDPADHDPRLLFLSAAHPSCGTASRKKSGSTELTNVSAFKHRPSCGTMNFLFSSQFASPPLATRRRSWLGEFQPRRSANHHATCHLYLVPIPCFLHKQHFLTIPTIFQVRCTYRITNKRVEREKILIITVSVCKVYHVHSRWLCQVSIIYPMCSRVKTRSK